MLQAKFSLEESHVRVSCTIQAVWIQGQERHVVRHALDRFRTELAQQRLRESADLYAEEPALDDGQS